MNVDTHPRTGKPHPFVLAVFPPPDARCTWGGYAPAKATPAAPDRPSRRPARKDGPTRGPKGTKP